MKKELNGKWNSYLPQGWVCTSAPKPKGNRWIDQELCEDCNSYGERSEFSVRKCECCKGVGWLERPNDVERICPECKGKREVEIETKLPCEKCNGKGYRPRMMQTFRLPAKGPCPNCEGSGWAVGCSSCGGTGHGEQLVSYYDHNLWGRIGIVSLDFEPEYLKTFDKNDSSKSGLEFLPEILNDLEPNNVGKKYFCPCPRKCEDTTDRSRRPNQTACQFCHGLGVVIAQHAPCKVCDGTGDGNEELGFECGHCSGTGEVFEDIIVDGEV